MGDITTRHVYNLKLDNTPGQTRKQTNSNESDNDNTKRINKQPTVAQGCPSYMKLRSVFHYVGVLEGRNTQQQGY